MTDSNRRSWSRGSRASHVFRDQAVAQAMKRKEEYLGARVPRWLKDKVNERAKDIGVPVSILIRNILEDAFREQGVVQAPAGADSRGQGHSAENAPRYPTVIGWEDIKLNRPMTCSGCGKQLDAGAYITLGFAVSGEEHVILCGLCKESL